MNYKYTLIISQFYHSRHMFIVEHPENFIEIAREFVKELMDYKRSEDSMRYGKEYLGDLDPEWTTDKIKSRYNLNDAGDIYLIQSDSVSHLNDVTMEYQYTSWEQSRGYIKKAVKEAIDTHHNYRKVREIVEKYFTIA